MILNTIVKTVKRKSHRGNQAVTTDQITTDIVACVNEAMRDVQKLIPKRFWWKSQNIAVVAGVAGTPAIYSLASDTHEISIITYVSSNVYYILQKMDSDREWLRQIWNPVMSTQRPMWYREIGPDTNGYKQIEIFPIPDASYTLKMEYYRLKGTDLTTADLQTAVPDLPDLYQDVIEKGALYYFLKGFDDQAQSVAKADYDQSRMAFDADDDADLDGELRIRMGSVKFELPGFRLT